MRLSIKRKLLELLVIFLLTSFVGTINGEQDNCLFQPAGEIETGGDPVTLRSRKVCPRFELLSKKLKKTLVLNLFPGQEFTAHLEPGKSDIEERQLWTGYLEGFAGSEVILVSGKGFLAGSIHYPGGAFRVNCDASGMHRVHQVNLPAIPPPSAPIPVALENGKLSPRPFPSSRTMVTDDGSIIDVMVVYTAAARQAAGGTDAILNLIALGLAETNQGYANSDVRQRVRLIYASEVDYSETDFNWNDCLYRLRDPGDGFIDNVHDLREEYGADLVTLLVEYHKVYWGLAYVMGTNSPGFESYAFSVVTTMGIGSYVLGHEWGHNMGCAHDRANAAVLGAYPYSFGYQAPGESFRTIMAYNCPHGCPRVNYWSNPDKLYNNQPMGIPGGEAGSADNRRTLDNTAFTVANFKLSINRPPVFNQAYDTVEVREGSTVSLDLSAQDPENERVFYRITDQPAGSIFDTNQGLFEWTPNYTQSGTYDIIFYAEDATNSVKQTVTIQVLNVKRISTRGKET